MEQIILPKIPSELLEIALRDMKLTISQGIKINMKEWGVNIGTPKCTVCFAGSVMLQTTKEEINPCNNFDNLTVDYSNNKNQYNFLDNIRQGYLEHAMYNLNIIPKQDDSNIYIKRSWISKIPKWKEYSKKNKEIFFKQIEDLITYFKSINL